MAYEAWSVLVEYTAGVWTDITSRVDTASEYFTIASGDTPEASADTGGMTLPIQNYDQAFTPGNPLTSQALMPGMRVRIRETVLDQVFDRLTGRVDYPEAEAWTQSNTTEPRDQLIMVPLVDEAAWIAKGAEFVSTLGEHIKFNGGPSLIAYWPMNESEGPDVNPAVGAPWTLTVTKAGNTVFDPAPNGQPSITFGDAVIPIADDISSISFEPTTTTTPAPDYVDSLMLTGTRPTSLTLTAGQVVTVVCWTRPGEQLAGAAAFTLIEVAHGDPVVGPSDTFAGIGVLSTGELFGRATTDTLTGSVTGPPCPQDQPIPIAFRFGFTPSVCELWVRGEVYTDTLGGVPGSWEFDDLNIAWLYPGSVNHAQVYLGSATDWTNADFVEQYQMGLTGLERQTTGQRIRTVLSYAGVDPADLGRVDDGASLMQVARMAGRNPMDLVAEAVETEQGEFYADGSGRPVFADRPRLYNI